MVLHQWLEGKGQPMWQGLILESVLYVPDLKCNLLSMSKLTKDMSCLVTFFPSYCEFQDLYLGKMIGSDEEKGGLYYILGLGHSLGSRLHIRSSFLLF